MLASTSSKKRPNTGFNKQCSGGSLQRYYSLLFLLLQALGLLPGWTCVNCLLLLLLGLLCAGLLLLCLLLCVLLTGTMLA